MSPCRGLSIGLVYTLSFCLFFELNPIVNVACDTAAPLSSRFPEDMRATPEVAKKTIVSKNEDNTMYVIEWVNCECEIKLEFL